jgi:cytochrome c
MKGYLLSILTIAVLGGGIGWAVQGERAAQPAAAMALPTDRGYRLPAPPAGIAALDGCAACHALRPGDAERSAPSLVGIVGRPVAASAWFGYSPALRHWGGTWTAERLADYLRDPIATVPGTSKTLSPVRDPARLEAIITALSGLGAS